MKRSRPGSHQTGLSLLDLTIVGAFVVPSREIKAQARASGALVDLRTNRVVLTASASTEGSRLGSAASEDGDEMKLLRSVRDEVVEKLTRQFLEECHRIAS